ncbi:cyclic nucleotide-binding domain-containing protein [Oceanispirochaeta crateris]|uniref:Cyclic nucleotide-binding domain-containing protein n=1 Tax=Oceanispirochaeta crateris TaxID=2518645 RepID=A0A5C1QRR9_9SPIO|nr:ion transporter [Oceanispirochaeta crateris]QEN09256.1 cyclic nucleotide-binding domain-containing protein [Oceanispirochaeta crateris]
MKIPILNPDSHSKIGWDILILILTIAITIIIPLIMVYHLPLSGFLLVFDILISLIFIADILIESHTAYSDQRELIRDKEKIMNRYMGMAFVTDLLAAFPFFMILSFFQNPLLLRIALLSNILRLLKLFRVKRTIGRIRNSKRLNPSFIRMSLLIFWILIAAHLISCAWMAIWEDPAALNPLNAESMYLRSFYWTVTTLTTIGYGDISPSTNLETIFVIIIELIGAGMYGFIIGNIANIIANIDIAKSQYQEKMEKVTTFLRYKNIPHDLKVKISDYYDYLWESRRGYDESSILQDLPKPLKTSVSLFLNRGIIQKVPIFKGANEEFIKEVILNLNPVVFTPGDYVVIKGEIGYEMYFISRGSVDVVSEDESIVYATLGAGSFFGEIALLLSAPRNATIKAKDYCDCYSLDKETFDQILVRFPEFAEKIREMAEKRRAETEEKQKKK